MHEVGNLKQVYIMMHGQQNIKLLQNFVLFDVQGIVPIHVGVNSRIIFILTLVYDKRGADIRYWRNV